VGNAIRSLAQHVTFDGLGLPLLIGISGIRNLLQRFRVIEPIE